MTNLPIDAMHVFYEAGEARGHLCVVEITEDGVVLALSHRAL